MDSSIEGVGLEEGIYKSRFTEDEDRRRRITWEILCSDFFQKFVPESSVIVDVGAGDGLFLQAISARHKIAVDLSVHVNSLAELGIEVHQCLATEFASKLVEPVDLVFMSNFLEHLPNKRLVLNVFQECKKALKPGGKLMILQPNIRYVGAAYWDYIDHHIALTEHSLAEGLQVAGFEVQKMIPRFLPYTQKSRMGRFTGLVRPYLMLRPAWWILGQQTFVLARSL